MPILQGLRSSLQTCAARIANGRDDCILRAASIVERPRARSGVRLLFHEICSRRRGEVAETTRRGRITGQRFAVLPSSRCNLHVAASDRVARFGSAHDATKLAGKEDRDKVVIVRKPADATRSSSPQRRRRCSAMARAVGVGKHLFVRQSVPDAAASGARTNQAEPSGRRARLSGQARQHEVTGAVTKKSGCFPFHRDGPAGRRTIINRPACLAQRRQNFAPPSRNTCRSMKHRVHAPAPESVPIRERSC
jgi:hypothetical protein